MTRFVGISFIPIFPFSCALGRWCLYVCLFSYRSRRSFIVNKQYLLSYTIICRFNLIFFIRVSTTFFILDNYCSYTHPPTCELDALTICFVEGPIRPSSTRMLRQNGHSTKEIKKKNKGSGDRRLHSTLGEEKKHRFVGFCLMASRRQLGLVVTCLALDPCSISMLVLEGVIDLPLLSSTMFCVVANQQHKSKQHELNY